MSTYSYHSNYYDNGVVREKNILEMKNEELDESLRRFYVEARNRSGEE